MLFYLELIAAIPRRQRYLIMLAPELLTPREVRTALQGRHEFVRFLARYEALLLEELSARRPASEAVG